MKVELADGNNASNFTATMYYARDAKATTSSSVLSMNVSRDVLFGVGYSANTSVLPGTYANGSVYSFLLVVTDGIETASATCVVDRAFANLHLSGQSTGGVAIGKFSSATYGNPLFECEFPAVFGGGINKGAVEIVNILIMVGIANVVDVHVVGTGSALRGAVICFYLSNEGVLAS